MQTEPILIVANLTAGYIDQVPVLHDINLELRDSEIVSILGPNGAGKSTLVKSILGLLRPNTGEIRLWGQSLLGKRPHRIALMGLGYVPQRANVFASMTVEDNLRLGCVGSSSRKGDDRLIEMLELFPALAVRRRQRAGHLSGGERQMVAIARALMRSPKVVLLDEPSAGLSPHVADIVFDKIRDINAAGVAVLLVEQNASRALAISERSYILNLGRTVLQGRGDDLLRDPKVVDLYLGGLRSDPA